jgi:Na+/proline symporter
MAQTTATGFTYVGITLGLPYAYQIGVILVTILAVIYVFTVGLWGSLIATWIKANMTMILHILTALVLWLAIGGPSVVVNEINNHAEKIDPNFLNLESISINTIPTKCAGVGAFLTTYATGLLANSFISR